MFFLVIQFGYAFWEIYNDYGEKVEFSVDALVEGNIRLVCGVNCYVKYVQMRDEMKKLHDNKAWLDLARQVSAIGYEIDQAYYYLGRSSEGLESYDAARTYYALALTAPKCGGFLDICDGFDFPREIKARNVFIVAAENSAALEEQKAFLQKVKLNLTDEQILYEAVKKIPSKYVEKNRDGYKKLMAMSPSNQTYKKKYLHYNKLSESKENTVDKEIVNSSFFEQEVTKSKSFAEALNNMEVADAFTKDRGKASIYVETNFWNAMSSNQKELFCYMLQTTYPMYAQSIQDKYSGRKLAETKIDGELSVIQ